MLTEQEQKRIRRYYIYPLVATACLVVAMLIGFEWVVCCAIGDLVFHGDTLDGLGTGTYGAIVVVYMIAFIVLLVTVRRGMKKAAWQEIVAKANLALSNKDYSDRLVTLIGAQAAGRLLGRSDNTYVQGAGNVMDAAAAVGTVITTHQMNKELSNNAKTVAAVCGVQLPKAKKYILAVVLIPVVLLAAAHIPHFVSSKQTAEAAMENASQTVCALQDAFEKGCVRISADDPKEKYSSNGYNFRAHLYEFDAPRDASVAVTVKNDGMIYEVYYSLDVDIHDTKENNLKNMQEDMRKLNAMLLSADVPAKFPRLLEQHTLPPEFLDAFAQGSYYEGIRRTVDDCVNVSFVTDSEEEYDKYSSSYVYLSVRAPRN